MTEQSFCIHLLTDDHHAFLRHIAENPLDQLRRDVYSDWLEENGEYDEAIRQRQWTPAYERLAAFIAHPSNNAGKTIDGFETSPDWQAIQEWITDLLNTGRIAIWAKYYDESTSLDGVLTQFCQDLETVTGQRIDSETREKAEFTCCY